MKIILSSVSYPPLISGVAVSVSQLADLLSKRGHKVVVITASSKLINQVEGGKVKVYKLRAFKNPFRQGSYTPFLVNKFLKEIIDKEKPDIIHAHDPTPYNLKLQKIADEKSIPFVVTNHFLMDMISYYVPALLRPIVMPRVLRQIINFYNNSTALTVPTNFVKKDLLSKGVLVPVHVVSNGIDKQRFKCPKKDNKKIHILNVGRVDKEKSLEILLRAVKLIPEKYNYSLTVVGEGTERKSLTAKARRDGLDKTVKFTGAITHPSVELTDLYVNCDFFVIPSSIETQSLVTLEAMASGKPVVACKSGALPELVEHNKNGFLFKKDDYKTLAKYMVKLLQDKNLRQKMGKRSFEIVEQHELQKVGDKVEKLYKSLKTS